MRFYSGDHGGQMNHHDIALCENPDLPAPPKDWDMFKTPVAVNHIAISMPSREAWLKQLAFLRSKGVKFHRRVNHGMTHSLYISDPNGYGVEVLYELPREVWGNDIQGPSATPSSCRPKATKPLSTIPIIRYLTERKSRRRAESSSSRRSKSVAPPLTVGCVCGAVRYEPTDAPGFALGDNPVYRVPPGSPPGIARARPNEGDGR
jgi:hypothetical protein